MIVKKFRWGINISLWSQSRPSPLNSESVRVSLSPGVYLPWDSRVNTSQTAADNSTEVLIENMEIERPVDMEKASKADKYIKPGLITFKIIQELVFFAVGLWLVVDSVMESFLKISDTYVGVFFLLVFPFVYLSLSLIGVLPKKCDKKKATRAGKFAFKVILVIQLGISIVVLIHQKEVDGMRSHILDRIHNNYTRTHTDTSDFTKYLNHYQIETHCCGLDSGDDFRNATYWNATTNSSGDVIVPESCCKHDLTSEAIDDCQTNPTADNSYYDQGCWENLSDLNHTLLIILAVVLGIVAAEILMLLLLQLLDCAQGRMGRGATDMGGGGH